MCLLCLLCASCVPPCLRVPPFSVLLAAFNLWQFLLMPLLSGNDAPDF